MIAQIRLPELTLESLWFPCVTALLQEYHRPGASVYLTLDRTSWGTVNLLVVSVVVNHRAWPVYWTSLDKKQAAILNGKPSGGHPLVCVSS